MERVRTGRPLPLAWAPYSHRSEVVGGRTRLASRRCNSHRHSEPLSSRSTYMRSALSLLLRDPARLARLVRQLPLRSLTPALRRSAFFLQGQMDINPRSMWYKPDFVARTGGFFPPSE